MKPFASLCNLLFALQLLCTPAIALSDLVSEGEFEGVVSQIEQKVKQVPARDADEIVGVVVAEPHPCAPGVTKFRLCKDDSQCVDVCVAADELNGCVIDERVKLKGHEVVPGCVASSQSSISPAPPCESTLPPICSLQGGMACGKISCGGLMGDGVNTSSCQMPITNCTDNPVRTCIPQNQCMVPDSNKCQTMQCTHDVVATIPPHETVNVPVPTMCVSPKSVHPPPTAGVKYTPGQHPSPEVAKLAASIQDVSRFMETNNMYDSVHMPPERRSGTIAQLAVWLSQYEKTGSSLDSVDPMVLRKQILDQGHVKLESLTAEQIQQLDQHCQSVCKQAETTMKLARDPRVQNLLSAAGLAH